MPTRPPGTPDVDLTFDGASGTINNAVFMTGLFQPTPDQFSSFLEIRNNGTEQGYNTDGTLQFNDRDVQNSTHSILLANVPIVVGDGSNGTTEGVAYREFRINIAEAGNTKQFLSLDGLQIWQEESGSLTNFTPGSGFAGSHTNYLAYNLDAGGDHWVGLLEPSNGNGANQTEFTVLIPDADFVNDPTHRYVTLYSKFGLQSGWESDSGSEEWGLNGDSTGPTPAMTVHKTATVDGGTANVVGEVISYAVTLANVGDVSLTGITVTDPSVTNLAPVVSSGFNVGDTNHDNQLSAGETWSYTASHTVTQTDLDTNGGGEGFITNTVTADSAQTTPISATASVEVVSGVSIALAKTSDVTSVDSANDVISYALAATNDGTVTLNNVQVDDSQVNIVTPVVDATAPILSTVNGINVPVLDGDYNVGDIGTVAHPEYAHDGIQEPGETFVFVNAGDADQNGTIDPGETFIFANAGDTNQNGTEDPGEHFQYYNAGDIGTVAHPEFAHNGVQDPGETFQFDVSHAANPVLVGGFNAGDTNQNGLLDVGETWQYTVSYTVTQDDIDNGGVVQPGLTHDNTATVTASPGASASATDTVTIVQNPHATLTKTATVADGTANAAGDVINYAIAVHNDGNMTLTSPVVSDPSVSGLALASGDTNSNGKIDVGETWQYTAHHNVTQSDIDNGGVVNPALTYNNTASLSTHEGASASGSASVPIVQNPDLTIVKSADVPSVDAAGEVIHYTVTVANAGNMTLTGLTVTDPLVTNLAYVSGDANSDGKLDLTETWTYAGSHPVTQPEMDAGGTINNTATADTAQTSPESASASVTVQQHPAMTLDKVGTFADDNHDGFAEVGEHINYTFTIANTGNVTLHNVNVSDAGVSMSGSPIASLGPAASDSTTWTASYAITQTDINNGSFANTASAAATEASATDSVTVTLPAPPPTVGLSIDDINNISQLSDPGGDGPSVGDPIQFFFQIKNLGNTTLTNVAVSDTLGDAVPGSLQTAVPTTLAGNATFGDTFNHFITAADLSAHHVIDDITVTALDYLSVSHTATWHYDFMV
jgi:uncharacterized repeat protein (TIGR01451 family)